MEEIFYFTVMKIFSKVIALLFLAVFAANAQHPNTRVSVYLHPVALLVGLDAKMPMIYSTVEIPFSLYNALTVRPSLWFNTDDVKGYRIGSDLGFRHYLSGRGEGMYLQPQAGVFYLSVDDIDFSWGWQDENRKKTEKSAMWYDFMGYFGYSYKFAYISIYSDTGIGYSCIAGDCFLSVDANFGIGIAF